MAGTTQVKVLCASNVLPVYCIFLSVLYFPLPGEMLLYSPLEVPIICLALL